MNRDKDIQTDRERKREKDIVTKILLTKKAIGEKKLSHIKEDIELPNGIDKLNR